MIERAKIKKEYAKVKRDYDVQAPARPTVTASEDDNPNEPKDDTQDDQKDTTDKSEPTIKPQAKRKRPPKAVPFTTEQRQAAKAKADAEERRKAREEAQRRRQAKLDERERFKRVMAKARTGGKNGQRKLGRESTVLLEKVSRMASEGRL